MEFFEQIALAAAVVALPFCYWLWAIAYRHPKAFKSLSILVLEAEAAVLFAVLGYWIGANASGGAAVEFVSVDRLGQYLAAHDAIQPPAALFLLMLLFAAYVLFLRALPDLGITAIPPPAATNDPSNDKTADKQ